MTLSLSTASLPVFRQGLGALDAILAKAAAWCETKKIDEAVLSATRLTPDMFPLSRQVQIACDFAKLATARLAGVEAPKYEDTEKTIADLRARIAKTLAFLGTVEAAKVDAAAGRTISFPARGKTASLAAEPYLMQYALPNYFFHLTTAYAILRQSGLDIGKVDFVGDVHGVTYS